MRYVTLIAVGLSVPLWAEAETLSVAVNSGVVAQGASGTITVSVSPESNVQYVMISYQNEAETDTAWSSPYVVTHQFNTPQLDLVVTATVKHLNGDPDTYANTTINVVGLTLSGNATPARAWSTAYLVQSNPTGIPITNVSFTYVSTNGFSWNSRSYNDANADGDDKSSWSGSMVASGTMSVSASVMGVEPSVNKSITITPRVWTTPISCAEDNEASWGNPPICIHPELGQNRDRDSNTPTWIFVPRGTNNDFSSAMTFSQIASGPSAGWWYIASSSLKCQRETVINRYLKANGPALGGYTFQQANALNECFTGNFLQAVKNHEYRGTPPIPQSLFGHQGRIESTILDAVNPSDPKMHVERLSALTLNDLKAMVKSVVQQDENEIIAFALDEAQLETTGANWGFGESSIGWEDHSGWLGTNWSDCSCGPSSF